MVMVEGMTHVISVAVLVTVNVRNVGGLEIYFIHTLIKLFVSKHIVINAINIIQMI